MHTWLGATRTWSPTRSVGNGRPGSQCHHPVLLIRRAHDAAPVPGLPSRAEHQAEPVVHRRRLRAAVLGERQAAGVDQEVLRLRRPMTLASTVTAMSSELVREDLGLEQVAEHVDPGPDLGDAVQMLRVQRGRRAAHRDDLRPVARPAQPRGRATTPTVPASATAASSVDVAPRVGMARMGHARRRGRPSRAATSSSRGFRRHPAAMLAAVHLDQRPYAPGMRRDRAGRRRVIGDHLIAAPAAFSAATSSSFCGVIPTA